jgi:hypothetical protein
LGVLNHLKPGFLSLRGKAAAGRSEDIQGKSFEDVNMAKMGLDAITLFAILYIFVPLLESTLSFKRILQERRRKRWWKHQGSESSHARCSFDSLPTKTASRKNLML